MAGLLQIFACQSRYTEKIFYVDIRELPRTIRGTTRKHHREGYTMKHRYEYTNHLGHVVVRRISDPASRLKMLQELEANNAKYAPTDSGYVRGDRLNEIRSLESFSNNQKKA